MIVQSPGERGYQSGIPAGLGRPSTGSRPPMNHNVPKPAPMTKPAPIGPPKLPSKPQRMQAGMINPLMPAGVRKNVQTLTPAVTQGANGAYPANDVQTATPSVLTPQQPVETMTAEVVPPHDYQGGSNNYTPTTQFTTRDAWNEWRRGRASFLG